nr:Beta-fructofuranosidase [Bacillus sp.] [Bacillus sp. (in: firmicutes)]
MNFKRLAKKAAAVTFRTAILVGADGPHIFAQQMNSGDYKEDYGFAHITRADMLKIPGQQNSPQFKVPQFNASAIKNIDSAKGYDKSGNLIDLDVWDSWPLQNADGTAANYHGYHIVSALAGDPKNSDDTPLHLFYQKVGDTSIDSWKNAGRVFEDMDKFVPNDPYLKYQTQEWSGSATLTKDGQVRLFYTDYSGNPEDGGTGAGNQIISTAQVNLSQPDAATLKVDGVSDHKSVFDGGDGTVYQNIQQFIDEGKWISGDNHTLRDPHYVEDKGHKYLVFEANTGTTDGYQGDQSFNNKAYYGGSDVFFQNEKNKLLQSPKKQIASLANGALGIVELADDYTVKSVMKPLVASNTVADEVERANIFKMNNKWYLFTDSRGSKMTSDGINDKDVYMLGPGGDSLNGPHNPINETGLVLNMNLDPADLTHTYSHCGIPHPEGNNVVLTSYMTNRGFYPEHHSHLRDKLGVNIKGSDTSGGENSSGQGQFP